jgi:hypothetical protein
MHYKKKATVSGALHVLSAAQKPLLTSANASDFGKKFSAGAVALKMAYPLTLSTPVATRGVSGGLVFGRRSGSFALLFRTKAVSVPFGGQEKACAKYLKHINYRRGPYNWPSRLLLGATVGRSIHCAGL